MIEGYFKLKFSSEGEKWNKVFIPTMLVLSKIANDKP